MSDVVFILGAGASKQAGGPLMYEFLDTAALLLAQGRVDEHKSQFEQVFRAISALQAVHSKSNLDLQNIESIFTALEVGKVLQKLPGFDVDEIAETIDALKRLIIVTLQTQMEFPFVDGRIVPHYPYGEFADLLLYLKKEAHPARSVSVLTFNYDIATDYALHNRGLSPNYGFSGPQFGDRTVPLLKLHGSINWATDSKTGDVVPLSMQDYFKKFGPQGPFYESKTISIPIGSQLQKYFHDFTESEVEPEPVIVPPVWSKGEYHQLLSEVWAQAAHELSEAQHIFIIGYSMPETDAFFRLLYGLGTAGSVPIRQFVVANPDRTGAVEGRFRDLLGPGALSRFEYWDSPFASVIDLIQSHFPPRNS